jgi:hypothetical protein
MESLLSNSLWIPLVMRNQIDNWLAGDWVVLGTHVQHWAVVIAAIALVALIVAWFERPKRAPARSSPRSYTSNHHAAAEPVRMSGRSAVPR